MDERERILEAILDIGEIMLIGGAEVNRVEDTVSRMARAYGFAKADVYVIPVAIVATVRGNQGDIHTQCRRVMQMSTDLTKVEQCNALSRRVCAEPLALEELRAAIEKIRRCSVFPRWVIFCAYGLMCGCFSVLFGGSASDAICAGVCGLLLFVVQLFCRRLRMQDVVQTLFASMLMGLAAVGMTSVGLTRTPDLIIMGTIMPMISGLALVTALRDMINNDLTSGVTGLLAALVRAMTIGLGLGLVFLWWNGQAYEGTVVESNRTLIQQLFHDTLPCVGSCLACASTFHVEGKHKYGAMAVGSLLGYYVYLIILHYMKNPALALVFGTLAVLASAEGIARTLKTPMTVVLVPMLIPMIPGGDLYRTMVNLVQGNMELASHYLRLVSSEAGGMAFAIILEASLMQLMMRIYRKCKCMEWIH